MKKLLALVLALMLLSAAALADGILNELGTYPLVTEPAELNIFFCRDAAPDNWEVETNYFTTYLEELTGVHVNWEYVIGDATACSQKVQTKLLSGDLPDVFSRCGFTRAQEMMYAAQGIFIPLNDLIEENTINIKAMFEELPAIKEQITAPDGNIYGIPNVNLYVHGTVYDKMWVNQTWLDALDMDMPETTEEFREMLIAFKENDPNGNGIQDEIGLVTQGVDITYLMNAFVYYDETFTMLEDGTIKYIATLDEFKQGIEYIRGLVADGLYASDSVTMDRTQRTALVMSGDVATVGALTALWPGHFATVESTIDDGGATRFWEYKPVAPLEGPNGLRGCYYNPGTVNEGNACEFAITSACENPALALRWLDYFFTYETYLTCTQGKKCESVDDLYMGVAGWIPAEEGTQGIDGKQALYIQYGLNNTVNCGWQSYAVVPRYLSFAGHSGMYCPEGHYEQMLYKTTVEDYQPYGGLKSIPPLYMESEELAVEFNELEVNLKNCVSTAIAQFITGVRDIDSEWDAFQAELSSYGLECYLEIYQEQYDLNYGE